MSPNMSIVSRESHQEMDQGQDHQHAGHCGKDEHDLRPLHIVLTEHLDLCLALHQHVHLLCACNQLGKYMDILCSAKKAPLLAHLVET